ncbi:peptidoglycan-binding domain-containing protein [Actinocorallia longicatena]|uniref:Peptidoglycan binding protein n=1 Tax=Actinocorallia longicatena TaxID=111803 RepID=A0ABP6Q3T8_9ACTN
MQLWCPFADKRPLSTKQTEEKIVPRVFIIHTMAGYLAGTEAMFRKQGYSGTESHFGIGGSWDGKARDGAIWQWQDLAHSADAQYAGNRIATSVETSDGAKSNVPWTARQVDAIIKLGVWWCRTTGNPARIVTDTDEKGFGWHSQFKAWNKASHTCPGAVRLKQYRNEIVPEIAHILGTDVETPLGRTLKLADPMMRGHDVERLQGLLNVHGANLDVDGVFGKNTDGAVRDFEKSRKLKVDGIVDGPTWKALTA